MDFLELCQRTAQETGVSKTAPSAVTGQVGRLADVVRWVNTAWMELQQRSNQWRFMTGRFTVNTTASDGEYAFGDCTDVGAALAISAFRDWHLDTFKIYLLSAGVATETPVNYLDYKSWYWTYNRGVIADSLPIQFSIGNSRQILLGPKPDGIYVLSGEYQKAATEMAVNADEPGLPSEYHMAIVYRAMMKYGRYAGAPEVYADGKAEYNRMMAEIMRTQLPELLLPEPMV